jgi:formylmethanofuran dehydrogenase subunit E
MSLRLRIGILALLLVGYGIVPVRAETPEEWVKLGARVHGGFGAFIPVGIRIGEDAMRRLNAQPRELSVVYYSGEGVPCPCSVDGVMLAVNASLGQGSVEVAAQKSPIGTFAVVVIRPGTGGDGLKYTVPMYHMAKLSEINRTIQDPLARYNAVMGIGDLFVVEPVK